MALNFTVLAVCHVLRGDIILEKPVWVDQPWKVIVIVYEFTVVIVWEITFCFWVVVFPFFLFGPVWLDSEGRPENSQPPTVNQTVVKYLQLSLAHSMPFTGITMDLYLSSIQIYPAHLVPIQLVAVLYLVYHLLQTFLLRGRDTPPIYPSHDWYTYPLRSALLASVCLFAIPCLFWVLFYISKRKIEARFPNGQSLLQAMQAGKE